MTILSDRVKLNKKQQEKPHKKNEIEVIFNDLKFENNKVYDTSEPNMSIVSLVSLLSFHLQNLHFTVNRPYRRHSSFSRLVS